MLNNNQREALYGEMSIQSSDIDVDKMSSLMLFPKAGMNESAVAGSKAIVSDGCGVYSGHGTTGDFTINLPEETYVRGVYAFNPEDKVIVFFDIDSVTNKVEFNSTVPITMVITVSEMITPKQIKDILNNLDKPLLKDVANLEYNLSKNTAGTFPIKLPLYDEATHPLIICTSDWRIYDDAGLDKRIHFFNGADNDVGAPGAYDYTPLTKEHFTLTGAIATLTTSNNTVGQGLSVSSITSGDKDLPHTDINGDILWSHASGSTKGNASTTTMGFTTNSKKFMVYLNAANINDCTHGSYGCRIRVNERDGLGWRYLNTQTTSTVTPPGPAERNYSLARSRIFMDDACENEVTELYDNTNIRLTEGRLYVEFPDDKVRDICIVSSLRDAGYRWLRVTPEAIVTPTILESPPVAFVGDSFLFGTAMEDLNRNYSNLISDWFGWTDVLQNAIGGSAFTQGASDRFKYEDRIDDLLVYKKRRGIPMLVIASISYNSNNNSSTIKEEIKSYIETFNSRFDSSDKLIIQGLIASSGSVHDLNGIERLGAEVINSYSNENIIFIPFQLRDSGCIVNSENEEEYLGDATHFNVKGHVLTAEYLVREIYKHLSEWATEFKLTTDILQKNIIKSICEFPTQGHNVDAVTGLEINVANGVDGSNVNQVAVTELLETGLQSALYKDNLIRTNPYEFKFRNGSHGITDKPITNAVKNIQEFEFLVEVKQSDQTGSNRGIFTARSGGFIFSLNYYPRSNYPLRVEMGDLNLTGGRTAISLHPSPLVNSPIGNINIKMWKLNTKIVLNIVLDYSTDSIKIYTNGYLNRSMNGVGIQKVKSMAAIGATINNSTISNYSDIEYGQLTQYIHYRTDDEIKASAENILKEAGYSVRSHVSLNFNGPDGPTTDPYIEKSYGWNSDEYKHSVENVAIPPYIDNNRMAFSASGSAETEIKSRSEIVLGGTNSITNIHKGSFKFELGANCLNTDIDWMVMKQFHQVESGAPILSFNIDNGSEFVVATRDQQHLIDGSSTRHFDSPVIEGTVYAVEYEMKGGYNNDAYLKVWFDSVLVVDVAGINIGKTTINDLTYVNERDRVVNVKMGNYRSATETPRVESTVYVHEAEYSCTLP